MWVRKTILKMMWKANKEDKMAENELIKQFENASMVIFKQLADFKKQKEAMEQQEAKLKADLEKAMEEHGIKSFSNDYVTLSFVEASSTESIDLKAMQKKEPKLYEELLADYKKVTNKKAYVRITVK